MSESALTSQDGEVILAQEQGAKMSDASAGGELEGTLVLTNQRLIFVITGEKTEALNYPLAFNPVAKVRFLYSDVEELARIPLDPPNLFIPLTLISTVKKHGGELSRPAIEVRWRDAEGERSSVFTELLTGRRKRNLNDWAPIIENLKAGKLNLVSLPPAPGVDRLEGKVMRVLADMQEKGLLTIEDQVENQFSLELDPDDVEAACEKLVAQGLLKKYPDSSGDVFYRRISPLGEEDLSS